MLPLVSGLVPRQRRFCSQQVHFFGNRAIFSGNFFELFESWELKEADTSGAQTSYQLVADDRFGFVIEATAQSSVTALTRTVSIDPRQFPLLEWSWKISDVIESARLDEKKRDDAPVRVIISFGTDLMRGGLPKGSLCYLWATNEAKESLIPNPYNRGIMAIVAESGREGVGGWRDYRRNVLVDYKNAFGEEPGLIRAVTLLSDSDNTKTSVQGWYGPIGFSRESENRTDKVE